MDMFDKRRKERFERLQASGGWVPADRKVDPKPGDIIMFVSYMKDSKGKPQMEVSKAFFQHVAILVEPVRDYVDRHGNTDGTQRWVTADGGKGLSHAGQDRTGLTYRRYNPKTQQFITDNQTNLSEAAEGGRYLLGFWDITRLPKVTPPEPVKKGAPSSK
jgi:hypothetical protein